MTIYQLHRHSYDYNILLYLHSMWTRVCDCLRVWVACLLAIKCCHTRMSKCIAHGILPSQFILKTSLTPLAIALISDAWQIAARNTNFYRLLVCPDSGLKSRPSIRRTGVLTIRHGAGKQWVDVNVLHVQNQSIPGDRHLWRTTCWAVQINLSALTLHLYRDNCYNFIAVHQK